LRSSDTVGHVLIWMRDGALAARLRAELARARYASAWVASLPEAIAAFDLHFPCAVACTLQGRTPSLMDLETLLAYQSIGHPGLALPPAPVWALASRPEAYAREIEALDLPVRLLPADRGAQACVAEICRTLRPSAWGPGSPPGGEEDVLLALRDAREARLLERYLASAGIGARAAATPRETLRRLRERPARVLVSEAFDERRDGQSYWREIEEGWAGLPVLFIAASAERLGRLSPLALPRGTAGALCRPIPAAGLTAALRRLLRIAEREAAGAPPWIGTSA